MDSDAQNLFEIQVDDLKEALDRKNANYHEFKQKYRLLELQFQELKRELTKSNEQKRKQLKEIDEIRQENGKLKGALEHNDTMFAKQKSLMEKTLREKDLIATQMIRKNDENALLQKNMSLLKMSLDKGTALYNERLTDIKLLKTEIMNLRSQNNVLKRGLANTADMRHEVYVLFRKLNQEKVKSRALEEELMTPMNIHRWRKLTTHDPDSALILQKYLMQQKLLNNKTLALNNSQISLQNCQKKITSLENLMKKLPNHEVIKKLLLKQDQMNKYNKRIKAALAISRGNAWEIKDKDDLINLLKKELSEVKKELVREKQNKMKLLEKASPTTINQQPSKLKVNRKE